MTDFSIRIAFLVYDSRSGSTLLAKEITERFPEIFVTPEIGFDRLFMEGEKSLARNGWGKMLDKLYQSVEFRNFDIPKDEALDLISQNGKQSPSIADGIRILLFEFAKRHGHHDPQWIIVKNGSHIRQWHNMHSLFGQDLMFIHIFRDPRAVISSKLHTPRPYYPQEMMAWGGALLAALQWRHYVRSMKKGGAAGVKVHQVRYEDYILEPESELNKIGKFLNVSINHETTSRTYQIPDAETDIHKLVQSGDYDENRLKAWLNELPVQDRLIIESVCGPEMQELGYQGCNDFRYVKKLLIWLTALHATLTGVTRHYMLMIKSNHNERLRSKKECSKTP